MRLFGLLAIVFIATVSADSCGKKKGPLKARLEIKAICKNYTIRLIEGKIDTSLLVSDWTDETTGKSYKNVFAPGDPCEFPDSIKQGDDFYFTIDTVTSRKECLVCMAYYPTPPRRLFINVIDKPK